MGEGDQMTEAMRSPARVLGEWRAAIARLDALPAGAPEADAVERDVEELRLEYQQASLAWLDAEEEAAARFGVSGLGSGFEYERLAQDFATRAAREARERRAHTRADRDARPRAADDRRRIFDARSARRTEELRILAPR
jgi:hypothetical protein